ncbi:hypothetical protein DFA_07264 [Cavenderia fasciculata]|uniref:SET domain-containing protein n=1 Tax=Cavenderia fasciculata TaxID=261658 RepID=F4PVY0_CACFS|nr:uncharacterized protein DFA_07264 [Cavenderia fasciculata]EGG20144.1 hypothetical protein DFA_07264 [Cavenderia fasciculata]|eukprot:XP_004367127.1 hypothetical protein DFA_07264 [Cavenderia fasciculata]
MEDIDNDEDEFDLNSYLYQPQQQHGSSTTTTFMTTEDEDNSINIDDNPFIELRFNPLKGRSIHAKSFIPRGSILLKDKPYISIIDNKYKKNICNGCFKFFKPSNQQNVKKCPGCGEVYYCDSFCQQRSSFPETRHDERECRWLHYFSKTYKHQLLEDDKNIVILILRVLSRRIREKKSLEFMDQSSPSSNSSSSTTVPLTPKDIIDLCDHIDDYFSVSLDINQNNNNTIDNNNVTYTIKNELIEGTMVGHETEMEKDDYQTNWKHDFSKLLAISRIIQNILQPSQHTYITKIYNSSGTVSDETEGGASDQQDSLESESQSSNLGSHSDTGIRDDYRIVTRIDLNILKLLGKVRANYFGLWNYDNDVGGECYWAGAAVYLGLSLFNHSCLPNCSTIIQSEDFDRGSSANNYERMAVVAPDYMIDKELGRLNPLTFYIVALRDIQVDEELLITYIPLDQKLKERRNQLKSLWLFDCDCRRCKEELEIGGDNPEMNEFRMYCCPKQGGCNGGMLVPDHISSTTGSCRVCKLSYPLTII